MHQDSKDFIENLPSTLKRAISSHGELKSIIGVQTLWSGYGEVLRLKFSCSPPLILKYVKPPKQVNHPKGWSTKASHLRKIRSFAIESYWYAHYNFLDPHCRIPQAKASYAQDENIFALMEDLDASGFPERLKKARLKDIKTCVSWLARFHARFLGSRPINLWETGSYWHLETRQDEWEALKSDKLKLTAGLIDKKLNSAKHQTLVHGDAKLENFCFSQDFSKAAIVDFQYIGAGCGMKDLAYFMSSCMSSDDCFKYESLILDHYFSSLRNALQREIQELEAEWRSLYVYAWADFYRFLKGWSPEHWKIHSYSSLQAERAQNLILSGLKSEAITAVLDAGKIIMSRFQQDGPVFSKKAQSLASSVVTHADIESQEVILKRLAPSLKAYDLGLLAEEQTDNKDRLNKGYFWCVDPLDGTLQFSRGESGFAVSIALLSQKGDPLIAVVYDPYANNLYTAEVEGGCFKNGLRLSIGPDSEAKFLFADESLRKSPRYAQLNKEYEIIIKGGAVMNALWCLERPPSFYIKFPKSTRGGGSIWDFAAVSLLVKEAGGIATDYSGNKLKLNRPESTFMNEDGIYISSCNTRPKILKD